MEGFFPYKCWHSVFDGQTWSTPVPIQGRGRFQISEAMLTLAPTGRLILSVETYGQFSSKRYLGVQTLETKGWSALAKIWLIHDYMKMDTADYILRNPYRVRE
jgi:hypothetical protein